MPMNEIEELRNQLVAEISPLRVYLFGSFADGTNREQSDRRSQRPATDNSLRRNSSWRKSCRHC